MTTDAPLDDATLINRLKVLAADAIPVACDPIYTHVWEGANEDLLEAANRLYGYAEWSNDVRRLSREMAVMIDGEDAARQPSLCDVAAMVRDLVAKHADLCASGQVRALDDHRSFPEAADGRPLPPMADDLMTAGLNGEDARFVAIQLAQNGLSLTPAPQPAGEAEPVAWLPDATIEWLKSYDGPACATKTAAHIRPLKSGRGKPVYLHPPQPSLSVADPSSDDEPTAARWGWDGYGWAHYIDNGSGSTWQKRAEAHPDCELLYSRPKPSMSVEEAALLDLQYLANDLSWDRRTRDISDRIIASLHGLKGGEAND